MRVGSSGSESVDERHLGWFSRQSCSQYFACSRLESDDVSSGNSLPGRKMGHGVGASLTAFG